MSSGADLDRRWSDFSGELGSNLARLREGAGWSQEKLAHRAGISTYTYRKLENGESNPGTPANPRLKTLVQLATALGVSLGDILPAEVPARLP